jgi:hypothetical protein
VDDSELCLGKDIVSIGTDMIQGTTSAAFWRDLGKHEKHSYIFVGILEGTSYISLFNKTIDIFSTV